MKYGRVSSKEQEKEGFSIPAQLKLLDQYAQTQGLKIVREFVDAETAKRTGRTGFDEMIKFLKRCSKRALPIYSKDLCSMMKLWIGSSTPCLLLAYEGAAAMTTMH